MGTKKVESGYITHIENQENWDRLLKFQGLFVADLYQEWNGPCRSVISLFNKLGTEINSDKITFAQVKVDNVRSLHMYKGKCEPTFLIMGGGQLVGCIRGSNAPILRQLCLLKFDEELKVMKGEMERIVVRDTGIIRLDDIEDVLAETLYDFTEGELTFAIIKPEIMSDNKIDLLIEKLLEENFYIIRKEIRKLSREDIMNIYSKSLNMDNLEEFIVYMTSTKCCIMALGSDIHNCVIKLREITGPTEVENAEVTDPESLRAVYGLSGFKNAIHSADSREEAIRSISIMFPDLVIKKKDPTAEDIEKVIVLIPEKIYMDDKNSLINQLTKADLQIIKQTETTISKDDINFIYKEIWIKRELFDVRVEEMYGSNFFVLCLEGKNSLNVVNYMLGLYITDDEMDYSKLTVQDSEVPDLVYVSSTKENAIRDEHYFFSIDHTLGIIKPDAYEQRDEIIKLIISGGFSIPLSDDINLTKDEGEEIYKNIKDLTYFAPVIENMISGTSCLMVLCKYNAVKEWRDFIGVINPEEAAEESPDKLRGIFGSTIIQNALYGSSSKEDAFRCINLLFGNVQFDERGNVSIIKPITSPNSDSFPVTIYRPENIEEIKIQDVLKRFQYDKGMDLREIPKELSRKDVVKLHSSIKNPELYPNLKCFIEIASNIIPVFLHDENSAFQKVDQINTSSKNQKNNEIRFNLWMSKFVEENFEAELNYVLYKFNDSESNVLSDL